jgi:hypothetical protein
MKPKFQLSKAIDFAVKKALVMKIKVIIKGNIDYLRIFFPCIVIISSCNKDSFTVEKSEPLNLSHKSLNNVSVFNSYDKLISDTKPTGYWMLTKGYVSDASGHGMTGTYYGNGRGEAMLPNGETASIFNGTNNYFEIPNNSYQQVIRTGILTIEAWMRADVLDFPVTEAGKSYVHWMGKGARGTPRNDLWVARMYNLNRVPGDVSDPRPQRISGYCFNLSGGDGAGSYFQDATRVGTWIHYALVINTRNTSNQYKTGYTKVYKNGVLRDTDSLEEYNIVPGNSPAPMRVATSDLASFFKGAIGKVAIYDRELTAAELLSHNNRMRGL